LHATIRQHPDVAAHFAAFLGVSAIVIMTPGPDTALTIRNTLMGGRRAGILTALGVSSGQAIWTLASAGGIAALLAASEPAFLAVKLAGSAYLVWLGLQTIVRALRRGSGLAMQRRSVNARPDPGAVSVRQGLLSNLGNPKMAAFFPSLLPQFADSFWMLLALGLTFCALTFVWLTVYAFAVARVGGFLSRPAVRRTVEAVTGAVLVALGARLATERR
jgi:threonine/homoserine/homoserine lactone efflux protein